jgi:hypothetical protein
MRQAGEERTIMFEEYDLEYELEKRSEWACQLEI